MGFGWNPLGAFSVAAMALAWGSALVVYLARPERAQNRALAVALFLGGTANGTYFGLRLMMTTQADAFRMLAVGVTLLILLPASYLWFTSTLGAPMARFLHTRAALAIAVAYTVVMEAAWLTRPEWFVRDLVFSDAVRGWQFSLGPWLERGTLAILGAIQLLGFFVALSAYSRTQTPSTRQRAKAFAIAFGTRDLLQVVFIASFAFLGGLSWPLGPVLFENGIPASDALFTVLLAYGVLKTQLFDIDLKIKASLRQGLLTSIFVGGFFLAEETAQAVLQTRIGGLWIGVAAAAVLALALVPLKRFVARVANLAMPGVGEDPAYVSLRKHEVYQEAAEGILSDGNVSPKERAVLDRLRQKLALTPGEAQTIEAKVMAMMTKSSAARTGIPA